MTWTAEHRRAADRRGLRYPSDMTDAEWALVRPLIRPGGLFIADNALGSNEWWVTDAPGYADRDAVDRMNRQIAADTGFAAACVPIRQGVLVARKL